jgi:hypothetical protein
VVTYLKINNVAMPVPSSFTVLRSDLDSEKTSRSETGYLKRDRVRANVYKLQFEWIVQEADLQTLQSYLSLEKFTATFYDSTTGKYQSKTMYAGDRTCSLLRPSNTQSKTWWQFSCDLIEY